jgi:hypothetical protein
MSGRGTNIRNRQPRRRNAQYIEYVSPSMHAPLEGLPAPPEISEKVWHDCRASGDFRPILFEWYKYVGILCSLFACIRPESAILKKTPP